MANMPDNKCRIHATYRNRVSEQLLRGTFKVATTADIYRSSSGDFYPAMANLSGALNVTEGAASLDFEIMGTGDPADMPSGWQVTVEVRIEGVMDPYIYTIDAPPGGDVDLLSLLPPQAIPSGEEPLFVGVPGGLAKLSLDGTSVLNADGHPIVGGEGGSIDYSALNAHIANAEPHLEARSSRDFAKRLMNGL